MDEKRWFPIIPYGLDGGFMDIYKEVTCPIYTNIPWAMIAPHEERAKKNHYGWSLDRIADHGGLTAGDVVAILEDRPYRSQWSVQAACETLAAHVREWELSEEVRKTKAAALQGEDIWR